jgi:hypothetical protein
MLFFAFVVVSVHLPLKAETLSYSPQYSFQVALWGDRDSRGNIGVGAEIRTRTSLIHPPISTEAFWVGDNLEDGAFVQFGYVLQPVGNYCVTSVVLEGHHKCVGGSVPLRASEAAWFWEYFPNRNIIDTYYAGLGPSGSAGFNDTWHQYSILPNSVEGWDFMLDGRKVSTASIHSLAVSIDPVYVVAEEVTSLAARSHSRPIEFRNLIYLKQDGWHHVNSLNVLEGCGVTNPNCSPIPFKTPVRATNCLGKLEVIATKMAAERVLRTKPSS